MQGLLDSTITAFGQVDMLVNCAGTNSAIPYEQIPDDQWHKVVDGSLLTTHLGCQIFAPFMASQAHGGSILNVGSVTSHLPLSRVFAYSAAKAAVVNLTKNVAREYAPKNVRVNVLCPGFFPAEQNRKILDAERVENIMRGTPMRRFGEPHELVGARCCCSRATPARTSRAKISTAMAASLPCGFKRLPLPVTTLSRRPQAARLYSMRPPRTGRNPANIANR